MAIVQTDLMGELQGGPHFAEMIERRLGKDTDKAYSIRDVAEVFCIGETKVHDWIVEGRLLAANMNKGMTRPVDKDSPGKGTRPLRPLWRMTHKAILDLARNMEAGV